MLQVADVSFAYGRGRRVIDGVSIQIDRGALVGILGPNGSGKTTLLRLIAGTLQPNSGSVRLDGQELARLPRHLLARRLAVVPQETHLAFEYTALEIALMGRYPHLGAFQVEGPDDLASALAALDATGTRALADRSFQTLSGGEKQRVIVASALAQLDPGLHAQSPDRGARFLLLDEPTASLDLRYQIEVAALVRRLHEREQVTIVISTHDLHLARVVCSDIVLLRKGQVLGRGPAADMLTADRLSALYEVAPEHLTRMAM